MWGTIAIQAVNAAAAAKFEHDQFMESIADLAPEEQQRRIERRQERANEERRHRELVEAARPQKDNSAPFCAGVIGFILGMGIGS